MSLTYIGTSQAIIDSPGDYTIDRDLTQTSPTASCVVVNSGVHHVTIRLRSRLVGSGGAASTNSGICLISSNACCIIGDGGNIRGFCYGLNAVGCDLLRVRGLFVQDALFRGIKVQGNDALIRGNDIRNVTGATWTPDAYCMGIEVQGVGTSNDGKPKVLANHVQNVVGMGEGESVGISVTDKAVGGIVQGNTVRNPNQLEGSFGIWVGGASDVSVVHNHLDNYYYGIAYSSPPTGMVDENSFRNCLQDVLDSGGDVMIGGIDG